MYINTEQKQMSQAKDFITNKRTLLNSVGSVKTELYYLDDNTTVDLVESSALQGRFMQSTNLALGTFSTISIQNSGNFVHHCLLSLKLPPILQDQLLARGWGYSCIKEIDFTIGGSSMSQIRMDGTTLFQMIMAECRTSEKKDQILHLGGEEYTNPTADSVTAIVFIPLPWSSLATGERAKLGLDTALLSSDIKVNITYHSADKIFGGTAVKPTHFQEAFVSTREVELSNKNNSLRKELMNNPEKMAPFPMIKQETAPTLYTTTETNVSLNLTQLMESDLQSIVFTAHLASDFTSDGNNCPNPTFTLDCEDVELVYNGQTLFKLPHKMPNMLDLFYTDGGSLVNHSRVQAGTTTGTASEPDACYVYVLSMNMLKMNISYERAFSNTKRYPNQTMNLKLKIRNPANIAGPQPAEVHVSYLYSGIVEIQGGVSYVNFA